MCEPCDRLERFPEAERLAAALDERPQRFDRIALAIHGMPPRHEPARLSEQQEQHTVDDDERLVEEIGAPKAWTAGAPRRGERAEQVRERIVDPFLERDPYRGSVLFRQGDRAVEQNRRVAKGIRAQQAPEHAERILVVGGELEIELREAP